MTRSTDADRWTVKELATFWGVHINKVYDLIHRGEVQAVMIDHQYRISPEAITAYEERE